MGKVDGRAGAAALVMGVENGTMRKGFPWNGKRSARVIWTGQSRSPCFGTGRRERGGVAARSWSERTLTFYASDEFAGDAPRSRTRKRARGGRLRDGASMGR